MTIPFLELLVFLLDGKRQPSITAVNAESVERLQLKFFGHPRRMPSE
jgi:hypothetical protein